MMSDLASGDRKIHEVITEFLKEQDVEFEESRFCFGTSWDVGAKIKIKGRVEILGNFVTYMRIHNGISFYRDQGFLFELDITESELLKQIIARRN